MSDLVSGHNMRLANGLQGINSAGISLPDLHDLNERSAGISRKGTLVVYLAETTFSNNSGKLEIIDGQRLTLQGDRNERYIFTNRQDIEPT